LVSIRVTTSRVRQRRRLTTFFRSMLKKESIA
jgi:hypothetical protein